VTDTEAKLVRAQARIENLRACIASVACRLGCMSDPEIASLVSALETALILDDKAAEDEKR